jgi:hypothetical protein
MLWRILLSSRSVGSFSDSLFLSAVERRFLYVVGEADVNFSVGLYSGFLGLVGCDGDKASKGQWSYHLR